MAGSGAYKPITAGRTQTRFLQAVVARSTATSSVLILAQDQDVSHLAPRISEKLLAGLQLPGPGRRQSFEYRAPSLKAPKKGGGSKLAAADALSMGGGLFTYHVYGAEDGKHYFLCVTEGGALLRIA